MKKEALLAGIANELHYKNCLEVVKMKTLGIEEADINRLLEKHNF